MEKTLFLNLYKEDDRDFTKKMSHSLKAVENLLKSNGAQIFNNIEDVANFLNFEQIKENLDEYNPEYLGYDV